jgi:UDPglucose 6-dehydrogenase
MIGSGYVGLVSGACFSEFGVDVVCVDKNPARIESLLAGRMPIYEPGLEDLVEKNVRAGRLRFSTDLPAAVDGAEAVFIAVGTPSRAGDGGVDLSYVLAAAEEVARAATGPTVIVTKSTVPVGTGRQLQALARRVRPDLAISIASNPEFLREGAAIGDFMRPDRVVIGADSEEAQEVLKTLYRPLYLIERPFVITGLETAELIKYAANAFLAMKITFINEVANLCESVDADVHDVARAIGLDGRIGRKFLHPGPGFGGSCFPKDTRAFVHIGREAGRPQQLIETVVAVNEARKQQMIDRIVAAFGGSVAGRTIAALGLTFKPNTDDMRDAPSLMILPALQAAGAHIRAFDPAGVETARAMMPDLDYCGSVGEALYAADGAVVLTEWNEFRALAPDWMRRQMRGRIFLDLRNVYEPAAMDAAGFVYHSIGRAVRGTPVAAASVGR